MTFTVNLGVTIAHGKYNQWAWRIPIIVMQIYPILLLTCIRRLPETPRWFLYHERKNAAHASLKEIHEKDEAKSRLDNLVQAQEEESSRVISYTDMLRPNGAQFHPTVVTIMRQVNRALTVYGAVSVYGPQMFELLAFGVRTSESLTQGNYVF